VLDLLELAASFPCRCQSGLRGRVIGQRAVPHHGTGLLLPASSGHSLYIKDRRLRYTFNWIGTVLQDVVADDALTPGSHVLAAEFAATGPSTNPDMPGTEGKITLFVDDLQIGQGQIITQPGYFCLTGDGICVGRDSASAVTPEYEAPFPFTGGSIDRVVVDLSGEAYVDHESKVRAWFSID
jgi:hypothetical protein